MSAFSGQEAHHQQCRQDDPALGGFEEVERKQLLDLFLKHRGNKTRMAKELGISRTTLYKRIRKHGL